MRLFFLKQKSQNINLNIFDATKVLSTRRLIQKKAIRIDEGYQ